MEIAGNSSTISPTFSTPTKKRNLVFPNSPITPLHQQALLGRNGRSSKRCSPKSSFIRNSPKIDVVNTDWSIPLCGSPRNKSRPASRSDRFIPSRPNTANAFVNSISSDVPFDYSESVAEACGFDLNTRVLAFKLDAPEAKKPVDLRTQYNRPQRPVVAPAKRRFNTTPERVLDAPGIIDDYYLNLLDWSNLNVVAVALERNVYVWNADSGSVSALAETDESTYVASVKWSHDGSFLSVGLGNGLIDIYDVESQTKLRTMAGHQARVGCLSWNRHVLSSGSRSGAIHHHDVRIANHQIGTLQGHSSEVCGLAWRSDGLQLASGGNDNVVQIWDARSSIPKFTKTNHNAAVKAVAWCPWQSNLLATGGGTMDKQIHFWNAATGARVNTVDAGSQVTSLIWSPHSKEIMSTHGFPDNNLSIWSYSSSGLTKQVDIPAHDTRVLYSALSPDGRILSTAASDENLKFWRVYDGDHVKRPIPITKTPSSSITIR